MFATPWVKYGYGTTWASTIGQLALDVWRARNCAPNNLSAPFFAYCWSVEIPKMFALPRIDCASGRANCLKDAQEAATKAAIDYIDLNTK